jgi:hypothetical protein
MGVGINCGTASCGCDLSPVDAKIISLYDERVVIMQWFHSYLMVIGNIGLN